MAILFPQLRQEGIVHPAHERNRFINVNGPERVLSLTAGTILLYSGLKNFPAAPASSIIKVLAAGFLLYRGGSGHCPVYAECGTDTAKAENINTKHTFIVDMPRSDVYQFWRRLENLPLFMRHLKSVEQTDEKYSHWVAKIPGNMGTISWNAEIVEDKDFFIGWQSVEGSPVYNAGKVEFRDAPGGRGTEVQVVISYKAPAGGFGTQVAKFLNPLFENYVKEDIHNFKQFIQTGTIPEFEERA